MLPLSPKSREERSVWKPKRSRAGASHPRPNLRAPLPSSYPGLYPYDSHSPSHRVPSSTTQAHSWRASGASRLSTRSHEPQVFIKPSEQSNSPTPPQYLPPQQMFETDFRCNPFFPTPNQTPSLLLQSPLQPWGYGTSSPTTVPSALASAATSNRSRFSRANSSAFTCTTPLRRPSALSQPRRS